MAASLRPDPHPVCGAGTGAAAGRGHQGPLLPQEKLRPAGNLRHRFKAVRQVTSSSSSSVAFYLRKLLRDVKYPVQVTQLEPELRVLAQPAPPSLGTRVMAGTGVGVGGDPVRPRPRGCASSWCSQVSTGLELKCAHRYSCGERRARGAVGAGAGAQPARGGAAAAPAPADPRAVRRYVHMEGKMSSEGKTMLEINASTVVPSERRKGTQGNRGAPCVTTRCR